MSEKFRAQMAKAEADRAAAAAKHAKESEIAAKPKFQAGKNAAATLDSYDSTIRTGGRDSNLTYSEPGTFEWGPWLLRKILLGFNGFFLVMGFIVMVLGGVASEASFSAVAGKSWTVGIAIIGVLILALGAIGALGAYTKNRLILAIYMAFLVCMILIVFIIGVYIAATSPSTLMRQGWDKCSNDSKTSLQDYYGCCGLNEPSDSPGSPCPIIPTLNTTTYERVPGCVVDDNLICSDTITSQNYYCCYPATSTVACMPRFVSAFTSNFNAIGWLGVVISIVMAVCMLFSLLMYRMVQAAAPRFKIGS